MKRNKKILRMHEPSSKNTRLENYKVSIVVSFRNEEEVLAELLERLSFALKDTNTEIVLVNDDSTDESIHIIKNFPKRPNFEIVHVQTSRRFGGPYCIMAGFRIASGNCVINMDADLQDPPEFVPHLINEWKKGFDVVHTRRLSRDGENPVKLWLTKKAYNLIESLNELDLPSNVGDFKLLDRRVVDIICNLNEVDPYIKGLAHWVGFDQTIIDYHREARYAGDTKFPLFSTLDPYQQLLRGITAFSVKPLFLVAGLSFIGILILTVISIGVIILKFAGLTQQSWASLSLFPLLVGFFVITNQAVQTIYLGRMYKQLLNRPTVIIKSKQEL